MGRQTRHSAEKIAGIYIARAEGMLYADVEEKFNLPNATAYSIIKGLEKYLFYPDTVKNPGSRYAEAAEIVKMKLGEDIKPLPSNQTPKRRKRRNKSTTSLPTVQENKVTQPMPQATVHATPVENNFHVLERAMSDFTNGIAEFLELERASWEKEKGQAIEENRRLRLRIEELENTGFLHRIKSAFGVDTERKNV